MYRYSVFKPTSMTSFFDGSDLHTTTCWINQPWSCAYNNIFRNNYNIETIYWYNVLKAVNLNTNNVLTTLNAETVTVYTDEDSVANFTAYPSKVVIVVDPELVRVDITINGTYVIGHLWMHPGETIRLMDMTQVFGYTAPAESFAYIEYPVDITIDHHDIRACNSGSYTYSSVTCKIAAGVTSLDMTVDTPYISVNGNYISDYTEMCRSHTTIEYIKVATPRSNVLYSLKDAFYSCTTIKTVDLSECNDTIRGLYEAFRSCSNLTTVILPQSMKYVESMYYTFDGCTNLAPVVVPPLPRCTNFDHVARNYKQCDAPNMLAAMTCPIVSDMRYAFEAINAIDTIEVTVSSHKTCNVIGLFYNTSVSNITFKDCVFDNTSFDRVVTGTLNNVVFDNCTYVSNHIYNLLKDITINGTADLSGLTPMLPFKVTASITSNNYITAILPKNFYKYLQNTHTDGPTMHRQTRESLMDLYNQRYPLCTYMKSFGFMKGDTYSQDLCIYNFDAPMMEHLQRSIEEYNGPALRIYHMNLPKFTTMNEWCAYNNNYNSELVVRGVVLERSFNTMYYNFLRDTTRLNGKCFIDPELQKWTREGSFLLNDGTATRINSHEWVYENATSFKQFFYKGTYPARVFLKDICANPNMTSISFSEYCFDNMNGTRELVIGCSNDNIKINAPSDGSCFSVMNACEYLQLRGKAWRTLDTTKMQVYKTNCPKIKAVIYTSGTEGMPDVDGWTRTQWYLYKTSLGDPNFTYNVVYNCDGEIIPRDNITTKTPFYDFESCDLEGVTFARYERCYPNHLTMNIECFVTRSVSGCRISELTDEHIIVTPEYLWDGCTAIPSGSFHENVKSIYFERGCTTLTSLANVFRDLPNVEAIDISNLVAYCPITDFTSAFENCPNLRTVFIRNDYHSRSEYPITSISRMYYGCSSLIQPRICALFASGTDSREVFSGCSSLKYLDLGKVTCLPSTIDISGWFEGCTSLEEIEAPFVFYDIPTLNIAISSQIKGRRHASYEPIVPMITVTEKLSGVVIVKVPKVNQLFSIYTSSLRYYESINPELSLEIDGASEDTSFEFDVTMCDLDNAVVRFTDSLDPYEGFCKYSAFCIAPPVNNYDFGRWSIHLNNRLLFDTPGMFMNASGVVLPYDLILYGDCSRLFESFNGGYENASGFSFNTKYVTNITRIAYYYMSDASPIKFEDWDTSNVTNFNLVLCDYPFTVNISNFDFSKAINMTDVFVGLVIEGDLNMSSRNLYEITNMEYMFMIIIGLNTMTLNNWYMPRLTRIYVLLSIISIQSLHINSWNAPNLEELTYLVFDCESLVEIHACDWNVPKCASFTYFTKGCASLTLLDISGWTFSPTATFENFVSECGGNVKIRLNQNLYDTMIESFNFTGCSYEIV
jgi:hypothetical protein